MSAVADFYALALSAARANTERRDAVARSDATRYHAVLRAAPELKLAEPLRVVRRSIDMLADERRRLPAAATPGMRQIQEDQITAAIEQIAAGTLMWANEVLGRAPALATMESTGGVPDERNSVDAGLRGVGR